MYAVESMRVADERSVAFFPAYLSARNEVWKIIQLLIKSKKKNQFVFCSWRTSGRRWMIAGPMAVGLQLAHTLLFKVIYLLKPLVLQTPNCVKRWRVCIHNALPKKRYRKLADWASLHLKLGTRRWGTVLYFVYHTLHINTVSIVFWIIF